MSSEPREGEGRPDAEQAGADQGGADQHSPEGLDLAREMMRAAAGSTAAVDPLKRRGGSFTSGGGRSSGGSGGWGRGRGRVRPGEAQMSGAHPDGRDPQLLGPELDRLIGDRGWSLDLQVRGVFARWAEIVGPEIGAHSTPETLLDGVLTVRTDSTAWATQLTLLATDVVRRLNAELGDGIVSVVDVVGPNAPSWRHGRRRAPGSRGPRDTYG